MSKGLIGKKVGMTQIFDEKGMIIPVTVIEAGPCVVAQVKTVETDGYNAIQLGFGEVKSHKVNKPQAGHFAKANVEAKKHLREFRLDDVQNVKEKDSKVLSKDMDNTEDQWDMVLCIIEDQVQWDQHLHQVEYLKVKNYQDTWVYKK